MADAKNPSVQFNLTKPCTLLYAKDLFEKKPKYRGKGDMVYGGTFVFPADHPDLAGIKAAIAKAAQLANPNGAPNYKSPLKSGTRLMEKSKAKDPEKYAKYKEVNEFQTGKALLLPKSKVQPSLGVFIKDQGTIDLSDEAIKAQYRDRFYMGAEVLAVFSFQWYNAMEEGRDPGVTVYVNVVNATGGGKRIGTARVPASQAFKGYKGEYSGEDPLAGQSADTGDDDAF